MTRRYRFPCPRREKYERGEREIEMEIERGSPYIRSLHSQTRVPTVKRNVMLSWHRRAFDDS